MTAYNSLLGTLRILMRMVCIQYYELNSVLLEQTINLINIYLSLKKSGRYWLNASNLYVLLSPPQPRREGSLLQLVELCKLKIRPRRSRGPYFFNASDSTFHFKDVVKEIRTKPAFFFFQFGVLTKLQTESKLQTERKEIKYR